LVHNGYHFHRKMQRNNRCYWRCVIHDCPATFTTVDDKPIGFGRDHNHEGDITGIAANAFIAGVKKRCRDEVEPIPKIYDEELSALRDRECDDMTVELIGKIPTFYSCKSALYRNRSEVLPKLPKTQTTIVIEDAWTETLAGERFLLCDDTDTNGNRILIFATDDNLRRLCNAVIVYGDGTFYSCPGLFKQLYTLHAAVEDTTFPLVFAFLPNKTERTYVRLLTLLKEAVAERNSVFNPETFMLDFEIAARNAVMSVIPMTSLKGCFFHFCQCIWRKVQDCGLATRYREEEAIQKFIRRAAVLPLVPENRVEDVWLHALEENEDDSAAVTRVADYVTETWVEGTFGNWNHYDNDGPRTTNHVEGWHNRLNKKCGSAHPNIYSVLRMLQKEQAGNEAKIIQISAGGKQPPRKKKYRQLDSRLCNLKQRYRARQMTVFEYADAASYLLHLE